MTDVGVAIVGGGLVGMACAARLARAGHAPLLIEQHADFGQETSSRNSGVIHAGLYYEPGSLKALACVEGRERLYARCARDAIPHRRCGKLVVAAEAGELAALERLHARGRENGAGALRILSTAALHRLEPRVRGHAALWSPQSGIVDAHALLASYRREALQHGAELCRATRVDAVEPDGADLCIVTQGRDGERGQLRAERVINAAGLQADAIARSAGIPIDAIGYRVHLCKGDYFALAPELRGIVRHLVYPLPVHAGLGVHITLDLGGGLRAGPDTEYVDAPRYDVDADKAPLFAAALRRYLPDIHDAQLRPDYAGIRPKLQGPGDGPRDFALYSGARHGAPGLLNLFGIESPGLTASEALAERVASWLAGDAGVDQGAAR